MPGCLGSQAFLASRARDASYWPWRWICFIAIGALVPFWVFFSYWDTLTDAQKKATKLSIPRWPILLGLLAFVAWAITIPGTALLDWHVWSLKFAPAVTFAAALVLTIADMSRSVRRVARGRHGSARPVATIV